MDTRMDLRFEPVWEEIDRIREATADFLRGRGLSQDTVDAIAMVACELIENAMKYGEFGPGDTISLSVQHRPHAVLVEIKSPIGDVGSRNLALMDRMVQWIRGRQDPFEAYLSRLQEVSMQDLYEKESRLGLVRIAYEGQSILDFYVDENNQLAVSAVHPL
ncbi:MAG: ATP-binding protein [Deltaproteobacteria bacterium]|nr:ATP-binding protein [Deltaproteobacteria bacterium]